MGGANAQTAISLAGAHLSSPLFYFSESVQANADDLINIHEPSSSIILSAFYMVINSRIRGSFVMLSVLFVGFSPFFIETLNDKQYVKHHHQSLVQTTWQICIHT